MIQTIASPRAPTTFSGPLRIDDFVSFLVRGDRAPGTITSYSWAVKDFQAFLRSQGLLSLRQVTRAHLEAWQDRLMAAQLRPRSRSLAVTAVRAYLRWSIDHEACDARLAGWLTTVKVQPLQPKPLQQPDLSALLEHYTPLPPAGPNQLAQLRDRAMFLVLLSTGARVSEALAMPRAGFERCTIRQKGGSQKLLTIPEGVASIVREYLTHRADDSTLLFINHSTLQPLRPSSVREIWHRTCERIGIAPFTTHALRHSYATQLLEAGIDSRIVAELLGHKNMQTIMIYTKVLESSRKRAEEAIGQVLQLPAPDSRPDEDSPPDPRTQPRSGRGRPRYQLAESLGPAVVHRPPVPEPSTARAGRSHNQKASKPSCNPLSAEEEAWSHLAGAL
jgi:site-specific recombinase XerD